MAPGMGMGMGMETDATYFAREADFWKNYDKGRPKVPQTFFDRIFDYHTEKGGKWETVHDVGAGNAPYAQQLHQRFQHVILSDVVPKNTELARARVVQNGLDVKDFTFRTAKLEDCDGIPLGSVDMTLGMASIAKQLRSGGTFAAAAFGPARFEDEVLQDLWTRMGYEGGRQLLKSSTDDARSASIRVLGRTQGIYNIAPLNVNDWQPGAQRIHLNMSKGGIQAILPPEHAGLLSEPDFAGPDDEQIYTTEDGWSFEWNLSEVKEHMNSFPFISQFLEAHKNHYQKLDQLQDPFKGYFPVKIILATRR